ncbi:MAG: sensor histidine kinase [Chloroflexales bacterium]
MFAPILQPSDPDTDLTKLRARVAELETALIAQRRLTVQFVTAAREVHQHTQREASHRQPPVSFREVGGHSPHQYEHRYAEDDLTQALCAEQEARAEARAAQERLQILGERLVAVQEEERRHLARELHDEIGQMLTGLSLALSVSERLPPTMLQSQLAEARSQVGALIAQVRRRSLALRPTLLDDLGLRAALEWHIARYTEQTGVQIDAQIQGVDRRFAPQLELTAYRIVQEALTNIARHAGTSSANLHIWVVNEQLVILVEDMGQGFEVHATLEAHASSGLAGMRERAVLLGGDLTIDSEPGMGTRLLADLPLARESPADKAGCL